MNKKIKVIEFSGESCANCYSLFPILFEIMKSYDDCELIHIELTENNKDIIEKYQIDKVPLILILKDDIEIGRCRGYQPEEILEIWLKTKIIDARRK